MEGAHETISRRIRQVKSCSSLSERKFMYPSFGFLFWTSSLSRKILLMLFEKKSRRICYVHPGVPFQFFSLQLPGFLRSLENSYLLIQMDSFILLLTLFVSLQTWSRTWGFSSKTAKLRDLARTM